MSSSNSCFLTFIQVSQEAGQVAWYSHLFHNFPQFIVIHTVKGFGIVNKAEIDVFLELYCFFDDPVDVGNLISGSSAFSKTSLNIWKFTVHVLLKHGLENFEHYFISMWDECNCAVVWAFFSPCEIQRTRIWAKNKEYEYYIVPLKNVHQYFVSSFSIGKVFLHTFSLMIFRTLLGVNVLCLRKSEVKRCECHPWSMIPTFVFVTSLQLKH